MKRDMQLAHCRNTNNPALVPADGTYDFLRDWDGGDRMSLIYTADGQFDWSHMDARMAAAKKPVIYTFGSAPAWAVQTIAGAQASVWADNPTGNRPMQPKYLAKFTRELVTRYKGQICALEPQNEANAPGFYVGSMAHLAVQTEVIRDVAKGIDPSILITSPSFCYAPKCLYPCADVALQAFLDEVVPAFDVVAFHGYVDAAASPLSIADTVTALRGVTGGQWKLWDLEFGPAPAAAALTTYDAQYLWVLRALMARADAGLDLVAYYQWDNQTHGAGVDLSGNITAYGQAWLDFCRMMGRM